MAGLGLQGVSEQAIKDLVERVASEILGEKIMEFIRVNEAKLKELSLIERVVRVEEELKALREFVEKRFEVMDERFELYRGRWTSVLRLWRSAFNFLVGGLWWFYSNSWHTWFNFELCGRIKKEQNFKDLKVLR
jgi:hypothetical protein